nr:hypothetical protein K-LCC10_0405 [Kaumoebavirus]
MDYYSVVESLNMKNRMRGGADYYNGGSDSDVESDEDTRQDDNSEYVSIDKFIEDYNDRLSKRGGGEGIVRVYDVKWDDSESEPKTVGACEDPEEMIDLIVDRKGGADDEIEVDLDNVDSEDFDSYLRDALDENDLGDEKVFDLDDLLSQYNQKFSEMDRDEVMI